MTLWAEIENFQNLIVGVLGFAGVIFTLWFNGKEAREQRRDERSHDRETLRAALTEELKINRQSLEGNLESIAPPHPPSRGGVDVPTDPMDDAYRAFIHRISLLSQAEVSKVMYAYLDLRTYNAKLFVIGVPLPTGDRHVRVPIENFPALAGMQEALIGPIDEAIEIMERARGAG